MKKKPQGYEALGLFLFYAATQAQTDTFELPNGEITRDDPFKGLMEYNELGNQRINL